MNGDFKTDITRDTFHRRKHFARVLMQQGRVQLDADWNEQMDIFLHYMRMLAADLIGPHGGPDGSELGFEIIPRADVPAQTEEKEKEEEEEGGRRRRRGRKQKQQEYSKPPQQVTNAFEFVVSEGRYYVDGVLCENDRERYVFTIPGDIRGTDRDNATYIFYLDIWEREVTYLEDAGIREVALNGPDTTTRSKVEWRIRVQDIAKMKGAPSPDDKKYSPNNQFDLSIFKKDWTYFLRNWFKANRGLLKARTMEPENAYTDPCTIPPASQFRGRENQLYRVEIHRGGIAYQEPLGQGGRGGQSSYGSTGGAAYQQGRRSQASGKAQATQAQQQTYATFTWSRENGSIVFPISGSIGAGTVAANSSITVTLEGLGRDDSRFNLQEEEWVEIVDIEDMLEGQPGPLFQVTNVDNTTMEVTLVSKEDVTLDGDTEKGLLLRRWDYKEADPEQKGAIQLADDGAAMLIENKWLTLEDGVQVLFHREVEDADEVGETEDVDRPPRYRTGDYWIIPARTATGGIEWPSHGHEHFALSPHGVENHYAPLEIAIVDRNGVVVKDQSGNERKYDLRYKFKGVGM